MEQPKSHGSVSGMVNPCWVVLWKYVRERGGILSEELKAIKRQRMWRYLFTCTLSQMYHNPMTQSGLITFTTVLIPPKRAPMFPFAALDLQAEQQSPDQGHTGTDKGGTAALQIHLTVLIFRLSQFFVFAQDEQTPTSASVSSFFLKSGNWKKWHVTS